MLPKQRKTNGVKPIKKSKKTVRKKRKQSKRHMPHWLRNLLILLTVFFFASAGYYFFIRPYRFIWKECRGEKAYGVCMPCCYDVHGIDISHHQGEIDWRTLSDMRLEKYPIEFVFIKATEGTDHLDRTYNYNFEKAKDNNFIRGAYHFFSSLTDPELQAKHYINTVKLEKGDLPPVLDVEEAKHASGAELQQKVKVWLDIVESHYGVKPIIYTSYKFKNRHLDDTAFDVYPYWIAHYYVDSVRYTGDWSFWQHTDKSSIPGIKEKVDMNVFNGTFEELIQLTLK